VSTKNHLEHITWPKRSTAIINTSKNITKETAVEYRTAYRESAVVKNALQQRQYTKGNITALVVWSACVVWRTCGAQVLTGRTACVVSGIPI
jgi:acyl-coenzyme A synthetase/AMP-(fatty) acid ligase